MATKGLKIEGTFLYEKDTKNPVLLEAANLKVGNKYRITSERVGLDPENLKWNCRLENNCPYGDWMITSVNIGKLITEGCLVKSKYE